jgi:dGTPase
MEVSCIARTIVRALGLNEDLTEAIALAHDLGHPPFGHLGEATLNRLMADHGGFKHNTQSLRVVEELELKYPEFNGLNLSWEVREGLQKPYVAGSLEPGFIQPSLEAQVVDLADEIAYICHDLDDGLDSGLIHEPELRGLELWSTTQEQALRSYPHLEPERGRNYVLRCLLGRIADDVIAFSDATIKQQAPESSDDVRRRPAMIAFSPSMTKIAQLFDLLIGHPHLLSPQFETRVKKDGVHRATCDYLACLTDRQVYLQHQKLIGGLPSIDNVRLQQPALL